MTHDEFIHIQSEIWLMELRNIIVSPASDTRQAKSLFDVFLATAYEAGRNSVLTKQIKEGRV